MMPSQGVVVIVEILAVIASLAALSYILSGNRRATMSMRLGRRFHLVSPPPPSPPGPSIEQIAADVRRIRRDVRRIPPGAPAARRAGLQLAYDDVLRDACHTLGVPDTFSAMPPGTEREAERLRVEFLLEEAGLDLGWPGAA